MLKIAEQIVDKRKLIILISILLLIPTAISFLMTRINYDLLSYLPSEIESMKGQNILIDELGSGGFGIEVIKNMETKDIKNLKEKIESVDGVSKVLCYTGDIPKEMLPDSILKNIYNGEKNEDLMLIMFKGSMGSDETIKAVENIRLITGKQCLMSGVSSVCTDVKKIVAEEIVPYVVIAVILVSIILTLAMDSFIIPVLFLLDIGIAIVYNMGTNQILSDISYVTLALVAVLQLAVTMDYSIFLYHSFKEEQENYDTKEEAMAHAIKNTFSSVVGSSITTIAGFLALCFMSYKLGFNLGIVMAKGVLVGIICCITILPSLILVFDKQIQKTSHKNIFPDFTKIGDFVIKHYKKFALLFIIALVPALYGYFNTPVYYNLTDTLPKGTESLIANNLLIDDFNMGASSIIMYDKNMSDADAHKMINKLKKVDGVSGVLGTDALGDVPSVMIPDSVSKEVETDKYKIALISSEYKVATDEINKQLVDLNKILKEYDDSAMLIGEASSTNDLIDITNHDFKVVNYISIIAIFIIIFLVFKSVSIPVILVALIEFAIFINMGIPTFTGTKIPFISSIVIGTIQLGATVDYAILMTTRYKRERSSGLGKKEAVEVALKTSFNSILVSGTGFFLSTLGIAFYSRVDMIASICTLLSRGALISMFVVLFMLPSALIIFDKLIIKTTRNFDVVQEEL